MEQSYTAAFSTDSMVGCLCRDMLPQVVQGSQGELDVFEGLIINYLKIPNATLARLSKAIHESRSRQRDMQHNPGDIPIRNLCR